MANVIQIKRSATTATPSTLAVGELAYSEQSGNFFIGKTGSVVQKIGGENDVTKLAGIAAGAQVNTVDSVAGKTGVVTLVKADVGLGNVDNTSDANKPVSTATQTALDLKLNLAGGTLTGALSLSGAPTADLHAATKLYVDSVAVGLDIKQSCRAATTANITLSGTQTIDGVILVAGDRVLVKNQTVANENGIFVVAAGSWNRASDADNSAGQGTEVNSGMFTFIEEGTTLATTGWVLSTANPVVLGTTVLTFTQFTGGASYSAGTGIGIAGNVISIANHAASYVTSGTMAADRISTGTFGAADGSAITNLSAANLAGTINDARLSSAVLLNTSTIDGGTF